MENSIFLFAILLLTSVFFSKISDKFGIPALLLFLAVGMLAGSDGLLGIYFDDQKIAQNVGTIALIFILFGGGIDTVFKDIKPILKNGLILATFGVVLTALMLGGFVWLFFDFSWYESLLVGAIISSTDAAAVFAILRSRGIKLKNNLSPLLELESGSNDPMAIFLTITIIQAMSLGTSSSVSSWFYDLVIQFSLGGALGYIFGILLPLLLNKIKLSHWGLYPVFSIGWVLLLFSVSTEIGANGFIAVYLAGIFANTKEFLHKKNLVGFHDGVAWMMQVIVFITLGLLVFPKQLPEVALKGFLVALFLMFVARPVGVFVSLFFSKYQLNEKLFISWVGLRGVVPIILATYPFASNLEHSQIIFNIIFFIVLASVLIQGTTLSVVAKKLGVILKEKDEPVFKPIFYSSLKQFSIPRNSPAISKTIVELGLPDDFLILLTNRKGEYVKPSGSFVFEEDDLLLILCDNEQKYQQILEKFTFRS